MREWVRATGGALPCRWWSVAAGLEQIRQSFREDAEAQESITEMILKNEFLIIDDLGHIRATDWVKERFFELISSLYDHGRTVIITTNLREKELEEALDDTAAASRLLGMCHVVPLTGKDRRLS